MDGTRTAEVNADSGPTITNRTADTTTQMKAKPRGPVAELRDPAGSSNSGFGFAFALNYEMEDEGLGMQGCATYSIPHRGEYIAIVLLDNDTKELTV